MNALGRQKELSIGGKAVQTFVCCERSSMVLRALEHWPAKWNFVDSVTSTKSNLVLKGVSKGVSLLQEAKATAQGELRRDLQVVQKGMHTIGGNQLEGGPCCCCLENDRASN